MGASPPSVLATGSSARHRQTESNNICTLRNIRPNYFVMELVEGASPPNQSSLGACQCSSGEECDWGAPFVGTPDKTLVLPSATMAAATTVEASATTEAAEASASEVRSGHARC
jgi:hypothetical protein